MVSFEEVLDQAIEMLRRRGRVTYRALKRQFGLDDDFIEDLKEELCFSYPVVDEAGRGLVWTGGTENIQGTTTSQPDQAEPQPVVEQAQPTHVHTPSNASPVQDAAERRQLTILFTDLVDSTKLSSELDAEDYREIVRPYQDTCGEVIERFGCHIAQTLGDGLLIYSGYPVAHDNDAERAVRTGLGILEAMKTLNERLEQEKGIQLGIRVGIHTGPVVVGEVGVGASQEHLALGETPNIAARLQGLAEPDTVVMSAATYRLTQGYFDCEPLGKHDVRGVSQPIVIYRVLGDRGIQSRLDVCSTRGLTPLVGRHAELQLLIDRWDQAKSGQGQVVLLSGEAGIGKSRLVEVLKDHASADGAHTRLECRGSPYFTNSALYPMTDLIQRTLRWEPDDSADEKLTKLEQGLSQYRLPIEETVPLMAGLLSISLPEARYSTLNLTPQRQRQKTLETIVAMLLEPAEHEPLLFILEDLHWTDPSTLELLNLLIDQTPTASIYMLLTCRPEFQAHWANRSYCTQVTLNRLSRDGIEQIATKVAGEKILPDEVLHQLVAKTDGVPLYVEEMTKAALESGLLQDMNGHYELTGSMGSLTIPVTLQDSLMSRLDRLVAAKAIAQYGAVIGRQFSYALLQAVSQLDAAMLQHELRRLVEAELLYQRGIPPQSTYIFKHALVQDTAYESLLKSTRQQYHQRIAHVLEGQFPETIETQPELIAHHYTEASLPESAIAYWYKAGEHASRRMAPVEAMAHLQNGLTLLKTLPDSSKHAHQELTLLTTLGPVLLSTRGPASPEMEATYSRAYTLCQQVKDPTLRSRTLRGLWNFYLVHGEFSKAHEVGEQFFHHAQSQQDPALLMWGHCLRGMVAFYMGTLMQAQVHFEQGLALYDPQQHPSLAFVYGLDVGAAAQSFLAWIRWLCGYPEQALQTMHHALSMAQSLAHPFTLARVFAWVALVYQFRREPQSTLAWAEQAISLCTEQALPIWLANGPVLQAWARTQEESDPEDVMRIHQGLIERQAGGSFSWLPYLMGILSDVYWKNDQTDEGLSLVAEALSQVDRSSERWWESELYRLQGELLLRSKVAHHAEAESCFQHALEISRNQDAKSLELRAATSLARLWQRQGKVPEAQNLLTPVYEWFTEGFDTADLQEAKALLTEGVA